MGILATEIFLSIFWHKLKNDQNQKESETKKEPQYLHGGSDDPPCKNNLPERPILASLVALGEIFIFVSMVHTFVG